MSQELHYCSYIYQAKWTDLANISDWDNITHFPTLFIFLSKHPLSIQKQLLLNRNLASMWRLLKLVFDIQKLTLQINAVFTMLTLCSYFILYHFNNSCSFTLCMFFFFKYMYLKFAFAEIFAMRDSDLLLGNIILAYQETKNYTLLHLLFIFFVNYNEYVWWWIFKVVLIHDHLNNNINIHVHGKSLLFVQCFATPRMH